MVDEVTTWLLGNYLGRIRRFEHSWTYGLVDLLACGLFKLGVFPYLGGVNCKKNSLFSQGGVKRELWMIFRLTPWGGGGDVVIRVR